MWTILIAVAMGIAIYAVAKWMINLLATPPPPEPNPDDLVKVERKYHCTVCGLRLTVTQKRYGLSVGRPDEAPVVIPWLLAASD